jgi:hypothetical protein
MKFTVARVGFTRTSPRPEALIDGSDVGPGPWADVVVVITGTAMNLRTNSDLTGSLRK